MSQRLRKGFVLLLSSALLVCGGWLLTHQLSRVFPDDAKSSQTVNLTVRHTSANASELQGAFSADSVDNYVVQRNGDDVFSLLLAHYKDRNNQQYRAVLYPKSRNEKSPLPSPTNLRQTIWQAAAKAISENTPKEALILSWWDDGQRVHFLTGRNAWITRPAKETFNSPIWKNFQDDLLSASDAEREHLVKMASWLTMDADKALAEMQHFFGTSQPIYLLVTNDLLMRLAEIADYGGTALSFKSTTMPVRDNLHGDIGQIKRWTAEQGDGNYLVQKEGLYYHVWATPKLAGPEKNSLLVRLLPFVDSLKKLPERVHLVYQSNWGGYLSIYKLG